LSEALFEAVHPARQLVNALIGGPRIIRRALRRSVDFLHFRFNRGDVRVYRGDLLIDIIGGGASAEIQSAQDQNGGGSEALSL
jgi:hypothetical protein